MLLIARKQCRKNLISKPIMLCLHCMFSFYVSECVCMFLPWIILRIVWGRKCFYMVVGIKFLNFTIRALTLDICKITKCIFKTFSTQWIICSRCYSILLVWHRQNTFNIKYVKHEDPFFLLTDNTMQSQWFKKSRFSKAMVIGILLTAWCNGVKQHRLWFVHGWVIVLVCQYLLIVLRMRL